METQDDVKIPTREIIRAGLQQIDRSKELLASMLSMGFEGMTVERLLKDLSNANDPDVALANLVDIAKDLASQDKPLDIVVTTSEGLSNLIAVLGASDALGKLMRFRPKLVAAAAQDPQGTWEYSAEERRAAMLKAVGVEERDIVREDAVPVTTLTLADATTQLRATYREQLAAIMMKDVTAQDPTDIQPQVSNALSDLADAALEGALAIARGEVKGSEKIRFTIIGMGKLGAQELNYVSDVDLIYVVEPAEGEIEGMQLTRIGTKIGTTLQRVCQSVIPGATEPALWQIDGALRPEGKDGPLVRRLESHKAYYEQWAENWEFQALLKARPVAGDRALGNDYMTMTRPFVWNASLRENFVVDCQNMRERVEKLIPALLKDREIKLGQGGLRDVEFTVQMLQLVHGTNDESLHTRSTLESLQALSAGGYVSRAHAKLLEHDYRFERVLEHRQQMWALKRTHLFPDLGPGSIGGLQKKRDVSVDELNQIPELHRLARAFGMHPEELVEAYDDTRQEIRRLHMDIYYRPMLPFSAADKDNGGIELSEQAKLERYQSLGFADSAAAIRHINSLTDGVTRASKINRILLPAVLHWLARGQNPDMGLLYWSKLEDHFGAEHEYLGFLRDSSSAAQRLCHVLSNSRFLGDSLNKSLESITWLGNDDQLQPRTKESLVTQCNAIIARHADNANDCATMLRALRRHEIERIGLGWMNQVVTESAMLTGMTDVYDAILEAALNWCMAKQTEEMELQEPPASIAIIAMGRYGGKEVNFSSDADIIVVYRPSQSDNQVDSQANLFAKKVVEKLRALMQGPTTVEPKIELDMDLRPEGKNGPLVRSYASCEEYYKSWSSTWERQALLRARYAAGEESLALDFLENIANPLRYPNSKLTEEELGEIRKLKARMEAERLPRGIRRDHHLKLGKGGLSDVEWTVQLMQLQHAGEIPELRVNSTMAALDILEERGILGESDARILRKSWKMCTAARNGNYLWSGRANQADIIPVDVYTLGGIAVYLGYESHHGQQFENDLLAVMRRSREVCERLFYGIEED